MKNIQKIILFTAFLSMAAEGLCADFFQDIDDVFDDIEKQHKAMRNHFRSIFEGNNEEKSVSTTKKLTNYPTVTQKKLIDSAQIQYTINLPNINKEDLEVKIVSHEQTLYNRSNNSLPEEKILEISLKTKDSSNDHIAKDSDVFLQKKTFATFNNESKNNTTEKYVIEIINEIPHIQITLPPTIDYDTYSMDFIDNKLLITFNIKEKKSKEKVLTFNADNFNK